ncbi:hypothetical protein BG000_005353, partial [Podila horticola]
VASSDNKCDEKTPSTLPIPDDSSGSEYNAQNEKDQDTMVRTLGACEKPPKKFTELVGSGDLLSRLKTGMLWKVKDVSIWQHLADCQSEAMLTLELLVVDPDTLALEIFINTPKARQD